MPKEVKDHKSPRKLTHLVFAGLAFMFSLMGFAGDLGLFHLGRGRGGFPVEDSMAQGLVLMLIGLLFLYFYFNPRSKRPDKSD